MRRALVVVAVGLLLLTSLACVGAAEKVLRVAWIADPLILDPVASATNPAIWTSHNVQDNLVRLADDSAGFEARLASTWEAAANGLEWTFHLRHGVKYHNGEEVTAYDAAWSLNRCRDPNQCPYSGLFAPISDVVAIDRYTLKLVLGAPFAPLLATLAVFDAAIIPQAYFEQVGGSEGYSKHPVGAGPFVFDYWKPGEEVAFKKFADFWVSGEPKVDRLIYYIMPDATSRVLALRDGTVDVAAYVPFSEIASLKADPKFKVSVDQVYREDMIVVLHTVEPFGDVRVRQALNYAVNKQGIIDTVLFGYGEIATSYLPRIRYFDDTLEPYPYDPQKAKDLLKAAGLANGFKTTLNCNAGDPLQVSIATIVQQNLKDVGIDVAVEKLEEGTRGDQRVSMNYKMGVDFYTSDTADDDMLSDFGVDYNAVNAFWTNYNNPRVHQLAVEGRTTLDETRRREIYQELQRVVHDDAVWIFLVLTPSPTGMARNVQGFVLPRNHYYRWEKVWLDTPAP